MRERMGRWTAEKGGGPAEYTAPGVGGGRGREGGASNRVWAGGRQGRGMLVGVLYSENT
mgnify:CR=1 FL=1